MRLDSLFALHIPDGFLSVPVAIIGWVLLIITLFLPCAKPVPNWVNAKCH